MDKSAENLKHVEAAMDDLGRAMRSARKSLGKGLQLTSTQLEILMILSKNSNQTTGELAKSLFFTQSAITQTVETLYRRGLVVRLPGKNDRRIIQLHLSPAGRKITDRIHTMKHENMQLLVSSLSEDEVKTMISAIEKSTAMLKENQQKTSKKE
jgi:DNA-binding MarR family transcriptional regulator